MRRYSSILLIWVTVGLSLLELLSQLNLILIDLHFVLSLLVLVTFLVAIGLCWKRFQIDQKNILTGISSWDVEMKRDIPSFLQIRKIRLITSLSMVSILLIFKFVVPAILDKNQYQEIFMYLFVIGLFHVSLVSSLILFKIYRNVDWIAHENHLSTLEKA